MAQLLLDFTLESRERPCWHLLTQTEPSLTWVSWSSSSMSSVLIFNWSRRGVVPAGRSENWPRTLSRPGVFPSVDACEGVRKGVLNKTFGVAMISPPLVLVLSLLTSINGVFAPPSRGVWTVESIFKLWAWLRTLSCAVGNSGVRSLFKSGVRL